MSEESTTPDLVALTLRQFEAADHGDFDAIMSCWASDAVWDMSPMGLGLYEGAAIRRFFEDWRGSYEDYETEAEEVLDSVTESPSPSLSRMAVRLEAMATFECATPPSSRG